MFSDGLAFSAKKPVNPDNGRNLSITSVLFSYIRDSSRVFLVQLMMQLVDLSSGFLQRFFASRCDPVDAAPSAGQVL